jgi:hypothetical protein
MPFNDIPTLTNEANNHGALFGDSRLAVGIDSSNYAVIGLRTSLSEFSFSDHFIIAPLLRLCIGNYSTTKRAGWSLALGELEPMTIGQGLTIKDFRQVGGAGAIKLKDFSLSAIFWAQGYQNPEDMAAIGVSQALNVLNVGLNALFWDIQGIPDGITFQYWTQYYASLYLLPNFSINLPWARLYAEYGFKRKWENNVESFFNATPNLAHGLCVGIVFEDTIFGVGIKINQEFRHYTKGFIPATGVRSEYMVSLENEYYSQNNWIDFFTSQEKSSWYYHYISLESPSLKGFNLYVANELLYYASPQDTIVRSIQDVTTIFSYRPSTNYFWIGIRYAVKDFALLSLSVSNRLLNQAPGGNYAVPNSQYMRRFCPAQHPFLDFRVRWKI